MVSHTHNLTYLLKSDEDHYFGRIFELPAVIAQASTKNELKNQLIDGVLDYLKAFEDEHLLLIQDKLKTKLDKEDYGLGKVIGKKHLKVKCK